MSDTLLRENNEITLPVDVIQAAGLTPRDRIAWRLEQGEIRGRKLARRVGEIIEDSRTGLVYFDSDVTPEEAEAAALAANLDRE